LIIFILLPHDVNAVPLIIRDNANPKTYSEGIGLRMANRKGDDAVFSRDEMNALLGGSLGMLDTSANVSAVPFQRSDNISLQQRQDEVDVSKLTVAQTAARLKQADLEKQQKTKLQKSGKTSIVRAQRNQPTLSNRHVLLQEQLLAAQQQKQQAVAASNSQDEVIQSNDTSSEEDNALEGSNVKFQRKRGKGSVVVRTRIEPQVIKRSHERRRKYSSSDDSDNDSSASSSKSQRRIRSKQNDDHSSTSSGDSEEDRRRQRVLAKRRQLQTEANQYPEDNVKQSDNLQSNGETYDSLQSTIINDVDSPIVPQGLSPSSHRSSDNQQDSSSASNSTSSSDSSSSDDDISHPVLAKPLFVPRNQRQTVLSQNELKNKENEIEERKRAEEKSRKMESRNLVAQVVASSSFRSTKAMEDATEEGEGGSMSINPRPDDTDPTDPEDLEKEREAWEVRELERLLQQQDKLRQEEQEHKEYLRRRAMTDEERLREDQALGIYQKPGVGRQRDASLIDGDSKPLFPTKYFHRGAYYMDETEWTQDDIRHKAKEYERGITEEDKIDKSKLPKIMQVKHFGIARRGTKYKGLAQEDTTDKSQTFLSMNQSRK
jgi:microfibrillar-associated protein 1